MNFRVAWACVREALRDFHWREYAPFGWILLIQLFVLICASNLGSSWGMATAGALITLVFGDRALHYPASFYLLPSFMALFDAALYLVLGSLAIPVSLTRIFAPMEGAGQDRRSAGARALRAYPAVFCVSTVTLAILLLGWPWVVRIGPSRWIHSLMSGGPGDLLSWVVAALGAYAVGCLFLYVPIHAIQPGVGFGKAIAAGVAEGARLLAFTLFITLALMWPALPLLAAVQLRPAVIISKFRPELIAVMFGIYMVLSNVATYLIYAAAARLHWAVRRGPA